LIIDNSQLTVANALAQSKVILQPISDTSSLDAQVLLAHILQKPRTWVLAHLEAQLSPAQIDSLSQNLSLLETSTPLPYVLGHWEFYGLDFIVSPAVLIPRPETELLVEEALTWINKINEPRRHKERKDKNTSYSWRSSCVAAGVQSIRGELSHQYLLVADIGTGSGCIAVTLAKQISNLHVIATDKSEDALEIARTNALKHNITDRIEFIKSDLFEKLDLQRATARLITGGDAKGYDVICANLPYIPTATLHGLKVYGREPTLALDGGPDGLNIIRRLLKNAPQYLAPGGLLLLEIDESQGVAAQTLAQEAFPKADVQLLPDLAGHDRLIRVEN